MNDSFIPGDILNIKPGIYSNEFNISCLKKVEYIKRLDEYRCNVRIITGHATFRWNYYIHKENETIDIIESIFIKSYEPNVESDYEIY